MKNMKKYYVYKVPKCSDIIWIKVLILAKR